MAVGSGLSSSFGIATESTPGVPATVARFVEFDSETLENKKHTVQGEGMRGGALVARSVRRSVVARESAGDVSFDAMVSGLGLFLQHMLGSYSTTPTSLGGGLYQQVHTPGALQGKAFTAQVVRPTTPGVLTQDAFTYIGCKCTEWELSVQQNQQLKLKLTVDALDEATPANAFAPTALAAATTADATSFTTTATIPAGSYVIIDTGSVAEVVQTGTPSGSSSPYTIPVAKSLSSSSGSAALVNAHASGAVVSSATGVNYGAAVAMQAPSYTVGNTLFNFAGGSLVVGGTTSSVSGVWTNTGGTTVANVRSMSLTGTNALKTDRWGAGSQLRSEQLDNGWRTYKAETEVEYNSQLFDAAYLADVQVALVFKFVCTSNPDWYLQIYLPAAFQDDGGNPQVGGPDIIIQKLTWVIDDDGVNGFLQAVLVNGDSQV